MTLLTMSPKSFESQMKFFNSHQVCIIYIATKGFESMAYHAERLGSPDDFDMLSQRHCSSDCVSICVYSGCLCIVVTKKRL